MRVKRTWLILFWLLPTLTLAEDVQPDPALLEFLGEWKNDDQDWSDPVDILDMQLGDDRNLKAESEQ